MQVEKNTVVAFHYRLSGDGGELLETSRDGEPVLHLQGHPGVLRGVEEALEGRAAGDKVDVTLPPEQAYGRRRDNAVQRVPIKHLLTKGRLRPGMAVKINTEQGARDATVVKVGKFNVDVDTNHPLAGRAITFELEVLSVRAASAEELAHGHAHGVGGHQH